MKKFGVRYRSTMQDKSTVLFPLGLRLEICSVLTTAEKNDIVQWVQRMVLRGLPVRREDIVSSVQNMLEDDPDHETTLNGRKPRRGWFKAFLRRHKGLSVRNPEHISRSRLLVTEPYIRKQFATLRKNSVNLSALDVMEDPFSIFNSDEAGSQLSPGDGRVIGERTSMNFYVVASGTGKNSVEIMMTFNDSMILYLYNNKLPANIRDLVPLHFCVGSSHSDWTMSENFYS